MHHNIQCPHPAVQEWIEWEVKLHNFDLYYGAARIGITPQQLDERFFQIFDAAWPIPYVRVPLSKYHNFVHNTGYLSHQSHPLLFEEGPEAAFRFFVHPDLSDLVSSSLPSDVLFVSVEQSEFLALPTSSCRTLVVWHPNLSKTPTMVKVSVFRQVGPRIRYVDWGECNYHMRSRVILQSVRNGDYICENLRILDEVAFFGIPLRKSIPLTNQLQPEVTAELWTLGNIVRDFPSDLLSGETKMLCNTAYMSPIRTPQTFIEFIADKSNRTALVSLQETLIDPGFRAIESLAMNHGISIEPHAQNLLINLDRDFVPDGTLTLRDFGLICVDPLRAFLFSPQTIFALSNHHRDTKFVEKETELGRCNVLMSTGHYFIYMNVHRALLSLISRDIISESQAETVMDSLCSRAIEFLQRYYRRPFECDLLNPYPAWESGLNVKLRPRIDDYQEDFFFTSSVQAQCEDTIRGIDQSKSLRMVASYEPMPSQPLQWWSHKSGYAGVGADGKILCLLMSSRIA